MAVVVVMLPRKDLIIRLLKYFARCDHILLGWLLLFSLLFLLEDAS